MIRSPFNVLSRPFEKTRKGNIEASGDNILNIQRNNIIDKAEGTSNVTFNNK